MKAKRVIVSVTNDLSTDQRVDKVCTFLHDNGFDVLLVGRKLKNSLPLNDRIYPTKRFRLLFKTKAIFYANYNLRLFLFLCFHRFDILVSNDLDTLLANFCAHKLRRKSRLVYDSHELFTEVPELTARPRVRKVWLKIEQEIFPKLKTIITVNQSIADIYKKKYGQNLYVVRNISPLWVSKNILTKQELGLPEDKKIIILQGAGINVDRGGEEAVEAMQSIDNSLFLIVGSGDIIPQLKAKTEELHLENKVRFIPRIPYQEMMNYTFHADIGLSLDKDTNANYHYSLPNKIFDYIHTSTPIVCSDLVEIKKIVQKYDVGRVISHHSVQGIASTIKELIDNTALLDELKVNCKKAAQQENWEKESAVLKEIYCS